jgi:hypothetical protein
MRKYPNPQSPQVYSVDTISRTMDPDTGVIRSERVLGIQQGAPKWITKVGGGATGQGARSGGGGCRDWTGEWGCGTGCWRLAALRP